MNQNQSRHATLLNAYQLYLIDGECASFIKAVGERYSLATLHRLAESEDPIVRRAAVLAIGQLGDSTSIDLVGLLLSDTDRRVRMVADDSFKSLWTRAIEPRGRAWMDKLLDFIEANRHQEGLELADRIIEHYPSMPEAYCRRALIRFNLGLISEAVQDCEECIRLSPNHYMAYIGMGQCLLELDSPQAALEAFRYSLSIFPDLEAVRLQVRRLEQMLREKT